jgi:nucleoside phosphorylase
MGWLMEWREYIASKRTQDIWGAIALDHYALLKGTASAATPSEYIKWLIDNVYSEGADPVAFHRVFLGVCVRLLGGDWDVICGFSGQLLARAFPSGASPATLSEIAKQFAVYHMEGRFRDMLALSAGLQGDKEDAPIGVSRSDKPAASVREQPMSFKTVDVAIITVLPEEYQAVLAEMDDHWLEPGSEARPNVYQWELGIIQKAGADEKYTAAIALAGYAGTLSGQAVTRATIERWAPSYILLVGIAGGFKRDGVRLGDVVISREILGYEYGKIGGVFTPRPDLTFPVSQSLYRAALALPVANAEWAQDIKVKAPTSGFVPKMVPGYVASGDKIVDDPTNEFFQNVLSTWPKLNAVEMEGAGAAHAADAAKDEGNAVRLLMIRGISDMPKLSVDTLVGPSASQTAERDAWKAFASSGAAHFAVELVRHRWPQPPRKS